MGRALIYPLAVGKKAQRHWHRAVTPDPRANSSEQAACPGAGGKGATDLSEEKGRPSPAPVTEHGEAPSLVFGREPQATGHRGLDLGLAPDEFGRN